MDPITGAIAGVASLIGGERANGANRDAANATNAMSMEQLRKAHQYEVEDLREAGLNPILSANGGGATPGGLNTPSLSDTVSPAVNSGLSSAIAIKSQNADLDLKKEQTALTATQERGQSATNSKIVDETMKTQAEERNIRQDTEAKKHQTDSIYLQNKMLRETMPSMIKEAKAKGDWSQVNQALGALKTGTSTASDVVDMVNPVKLKIKTGK